MSSVCSHLDYSHTPVLKKEVVHHLRIRPEGIYLDGTIGSGGHASAIQSRLSEEGILVGLDVDEEAIRHCRTAYSASSNCHLFNGSYDNFPQYLLSLGVEQVDGMLLDLGLSSHQIESPDRGFSHQIEGPLDMRFDVSSPLTAEEIMNRWDEDKLRDVIWKLGEERQAAGIARIIVKRRKLKPMTTTFDLRDAVLSVVIGRYARKSLSRVFQAFRIAVNGELDTLRDFLDRFVKHLRLEGRIVILSYHSLEDRLVKNKFKELAHGCVCPPDLPTCVCGREPCMKILTKRPITSSESEISRNRRARSVRMRAAERIA
ncbi:MAG: 16S rRNA (cytosine(1402)-N(4))-methyltransferase RsmH [Candidatus Neomarinimicrobiota bacterium]